MCPVELGWRGDEPASLLLLPIETRLEGLSLTDPLVFGSALAVIALLALGHRIVRRQAGREAAAAAAAAEPAEQVSGCERPGT